MKVHIDMILREAAIKMNGYVTGAALKFVIDNKTETQAMTDGKLQ